MWRNLIFLKKAENVACEQAVEENMWTQEGGDVSVEKTAKKELYNT
jgi:hypothetical protein